MRQNCCSFAWDNNRWSTSMVNPKVQAEKSHFNLDVPKGAEWMIRGAYTPSFRIKQHPLEDAGMKILNLVIYITFWCNARPKIAQNKMKRISDRPSNFHRNIAFQTFLASFRKMFWTRILPFGSWVSLWLLGQLPPVLPNFVKLHPDFVMISTCHKHPGLILSKMYCRSFHKCPAKGTAFDTVKLLQYP